MYLIVATTRFLLGYDLEAQRVDVLATGGPFYGVTWSPDGRTLALTEGGYEGEYTSLEDYAMADVGYMAIGNRSTWPFLNAPHQALWVDDHGIAVANTGRNAVARVLPESLAVVQRRYDRAVWDRYDRSAAPGSHLNSVHAHGGFLYAVAHNFSRPSFMLKLQWPSLDLVERIRMIGVAGVHNLWIDERDRWITCDSSAGALAEARTGERLWDAGVPCFTRGLAAAAERVFVGSSELGERGDRDFAASGVWVLDRSTLASRDYIDLGNFGGVQEVRVADAPDACHHGNVLERSALDALREQRARLRRERASRAVLPRPDPAVWQSRQGVFALIDDCLTGTRGALSLATWRDAADLRDGAVSARLHVHDRRDNDHASLVLRYQGPGDSRMYAALFQCTQASTLVASIWLEHNGWHQLGIAAVPEAALAEVHAGIPIAFSARGPRLWVSVAGRELLAVEDESIESGAAGIRSFGDSLVLDELCVRAE